MVEGFRKNTARYIDIFAHIADEIMPKRMKPVDPDEVLLSLFRSSVTNLRTYSESKEEKT